MVILYQDGKQELKLPTPQFMMAHGIGGGADDAVAPMPGVIEKVLVSPGTEVEEGDPLVVMIAMKMEVRTLILFLAYLIKVNGECNMRVTMVTG